MAVSSASLSAPSFDVEAIVRGYHKYKDVWNAMIGERLHCEREAGNVHDLYNIIVAVVKSGVVVGHVPRKMSSVCSLFLRHGGVIHCTVTGTRCYSQDLVQGGLQIPCILHFEGNQLDTVKAEKLIKAALRIVKTDCDDQEKRNLDVSSGKPSVADVMIHGMNKITLLGGEKLNDLPINFA